MPAKVATVLLAAVALLLFARLTIRHVGESYFLADQVDQLQKYEAALRLEPEGLWGGEMSGTTARALGPFGAFVFGVPVSLGLGIDAIHFITSLALAITTAVAFWQLARLNIVLAWTWLLIFTAMRMVWWNAGMFWVNTLLLPFGLLLLSLFTALLRRPAAASLAGVVLVLFLALQVNLVALTGLSIVALAVALSWRAVARRPTLPAVLVLATIVLAALPYSFAETLTGFRNTRAMFSHANAAVHSRSGEGRAAALETTRLAADPAGLVGSGDTGRAIIIGGTLAAAALLIVSVQRRRAGSTARRAGFTQIAWLTVAAVAGVAGQALFFAMMARPLNGLHYAMLLAPWYAVPPAALVAVVLPSREGAAREAASAVLGLAVIALLISRGPALADQSVERTPWNYRAIVTAIDTLCSGESVETVEGPGFVDDLNPSYDPVLRYLITRGFTRCRYDPASDALIVANRNGETPETLEHDGRRFTRDRVAPPGLVRYRVARLTQ